MNQLRDPVERENEDSESTLIEEIYSDTSYWSRILEERTSSHGICLLTVHVSCVEYLDGGGTLRH